MKVEIAQVLDSQTQRVLFHSDVGTAAGIWAGPESAKPGAAHVEFDIPDEVSHWTLIDDASSTSIEDGIEPDSGVEIVATVVQVGDGEDPVVSIRIGTDIVMIEMPESRSGLAPGATIRFTTPEVRLSPYDL